jgi:DNA-binding NarL/FixJ family response regulator
VYGCRAEGVWPSLIGSETTHSVGSPAGAFQIAMQRVLLYGGQPLVRLGLVELVAHMPQLAVCAEAATEQQAQHAIAQFKPDLAILDLRLGRDGGVELVRNLKTDAEGLKILVISDVDDTEYAERIMRAGASGYVLKTQNLEEVTTAIQAVLQDGLFVTKSLTTSLLRRMLQGAHNGREDGLDQLSDRELRIFEMIGFGMRMAEIAEKLHVSPKTVDSHRENIKRKLGQVTAAALKASATAWVQRQPEVMNLAGETSPNSV